MSPAQARPIPQAIGIGAKLAGDGTRYVAFNRTDGVPVVLDAKQGEVRPIQGAKGCTPVDVGADRVLLDCSDDFEEFEPARLASVKGGRSYRTQGSTRRTDLAEVGRYWMRGYPVCPAACSWIDYVKRSTGGRRSFSNGDRITGRHRLLSSPDLDLDRKKLHFRPHPRFVPPVSSRSVLDYSRHFYLVDGQGLRIWWSAGSSTRIGDSIGASSLNSHGISIGSGRVVWVRKRNLRSFELDSKRGTKCRLPSRGAKAAPVRQGAVVAVPAGGGDAATRYRIRIVRLG